MMCRARSIRCLVTVAGALGVGGCGAIPRASSDPGASPTDEVGQTGATATSLATASAPQTTGAALENSRPPAGYVRIPGGFVHPSCLRQVPNGALIDGDNNVHDAAGSLISHLSPCSHGIVPVVEQNVPAEKSRAVITSGGATPAQPGVGGYIEQAFQSVPAGASTWNNVQAMVSVPTQGGVDGETHYYWNGLYNGNTHDFVQPVLQWGPSDGPGGGDYWAIVSWAWVGNTPVTSPLAAVNPGDTLILGISLTGVRTHVWHCTLTAGRWGYPCYYTNDYTWLIKAVDLDTNASSNFSYTSRFANYDGLPRAYAAVYEGANLRSCPPASVTFSLIQLFSNRISDPDPTSQYWQTYAPFTSVATISFPSCFYGVEVGTSSTTLDQ